jgi:hypothetical protein
MKLPFSLVGAALLVLAHACPIQAQCFGDDGFAAGACCTTAASNLPVFPTLTVGGLGACILNCGVESQFNTQTTLAPQQVLCDYWLVGISIVTPTFTVGTPAGTVPLVAKYARTWTEFAGGPAGGTTLQVWRFLVNGDLTYSPSTASGPGCPIPLSALPPFSLPVHFIGNLDYALDCTTGQWQVAYTLTHLCPPESHAPFSQRFIPAAAGWLKRTYHFVGPANFAFGLCPAPSGPVIAEATRTSLGLLNPAIPYTCLHEVPVLQGNLLDQNVNCACTDPTPGPPPPRYTHQTLGAVEGCPGTVGAPIANFPGFGIPFMPTGLRALAIGSWLPVATSTYPGNKCVSLYLGILDSPGVCGPVGPPPALHAVSGVGTTGGNPVQLFSSPLPAFMPLEFLDLQNMLVLTPLGFTPGLGSLFASERIWSFNTP